MSARFEWDKSKDRVNQEKHHLSFETARKAFEDPNRLILEDEEHGQEEKRYFCIGKIHGNIVTVRFTWRGQSIRIFGAGFWRKGKKRYENR